MPATATITNISRTTPDSRQYTVQLSDGEFEGKQGHHTTVHIPDGYDDAGAVRPYSVLAVDGDEMTLMIRTYPDGTVSKFMSERSVGDEILVQDSLKGNLTLESDTRDSVFISTGTGITPMVGMLHEFVQSDGGTATFMYGEKTKEHLMYKAMLEQYELLYDVEAVFALSREEWAGREGYIQRQLDDVFDEFDGQRDYYVCGVPQMVVATKEYLAELGVPEENIYSEGWEGGAVSN